jgi:tripartite-type tricarboxylate transporter receptor subunit TctC
MLTRRHLFTASAVGLACAASGNLQRAYALAINKPVRIIVGFPAGGGTDVIARILADRLRGTYASTVLVENKPGAAARLSVEHVKSSEPDGSTMLFTPDFPITVYPHSFRSLNYDSLRDFTPVAPAAKSMLTYNVGPAVPESVKTRPQGAATSLARACGRIARLPLVSGRSFCRLGRREPYVRDAHI